MTSTLRGPVEFEDIQGLLRFGFKHHTEAIFLLYRIRDPVAARAWMAKAPVTSAVSQTPLPTTALQLAITCEGLHSLGVPQDIVSGFSLEFVEGMSGNAHRSRRLGDTGPNEPGRWQWGAASRVPHVGVFLYALPGHLLPLQEDIEAELTPGFELLSRLSTADMGGREPFGFTDGVSQPSIDWDRKRAPVDKAQTAYINLSCLGEYLLGYPNEYGLYTPRPMLEPARDAREVLTHAEDTPALKDLGRNGSYLVLRQLRQDVFGFWKALHAYAGGQADLRTRLAQAMVGRTLEVSL